jgi:hypothetical protein
MQQISSSRTTPLRGTDPAARTRRLTVTGAAAGALLCAAALDVVATVAKFESWAMLAFRGATLLFGVGIVLAISAAVLHSTQKARQLSMLTVTLAAAVDVGLRSSTMWSASHPDGMVLVLSIAIANLVALGAVFDGVVDDQNVLHRRSRATAPHGRERRLVLPRADDLWARWQVDMTQRSN